MKNQSIIIFDGVCNFCNKSVNFIIKRDKKEKFYFTAFQSEYAQKLLLEHNLTSQNLNTLILIKNNICFIKSDAVFEILKELSLFWQLLSIFRIVPKKARDYIYDKISQNRYKIYGKKESCMIPTAKQKKRFYE